MTKQFEILTGMKAAGMDINPFYGRTKSFVMAHIEDAKKVYKEVFKSFLCSSAILSANEQGVIPDTEFETVIKYADKIMQAKHLNGPPMEWRELEV